MIDQIEELLREVSILTAESERDAEDLRVKYLGKKGVIPALFTSFREVPKEQRKQVGQKLNQLKQLAEEKINTLKAGHVHVVSSTLEDLTKPSGTDKIGTLHPIHTVLREITAIFTQIGFSISEGPEIEDDWHNFSALNFPEEHPARDMQDTFFVNTSPDFALRTHTSSVQVRVMEKEDPPIKTISPGRVYRNEAISARSHCFFHQVEGLYIDRGVSFADLKRVLLHFAQRLFGDKTKIRLRPSYFPFTEPSAEMDIYWGMETEADYRITKGTGWLEVLGCGMVDPNVLKNCNIDPEEYSGFAFGVGIERIAMHLYQVTDIRTFYENDIRFLQQFRKRV